MMRDAKCPFKVIGLAGGLSAGHALPSARDFFSRWAVGGLGPAASAGASAGRSGDAPASPKIAVRTLSLFSVGSSGLLKVYVAA